jgi:sugar lactone lactonase YvrE
MQNVKEVNRQPSPGGRPQPLAFYGGQLWVGSWDTDKLYAIDTKDWDVVDEIAAPGKPYGLAKFGDALSVVVALDDDDRYLFRFRPGRGFDNKVACPDATGSHLAADGTTLYLCQQGKRRILALDGRGGVQREIALPVRCGGFAFDDSGKAFMLAADEEFEKLEFARVDLQPGVAAVDPIASVPFDGRALTFDGSTWWTSDREEGEIVAFTAPE